MTTKDRIESYFLLPVSRYCFAKQWGLVHGRHIFYCPPPFLHLYTTHGLHPVRVYCLLTSKCSETYAEVLRQLHHLTNDNVPHSIMIDFEQEMTTALNQEYHLLPPKGCLRHLSKSMYRYVQKLELSQCHMTDEQFWTNIRMIGSLSLVLIKDTIQAF